MPEEGQLSKKLQQKNTCTSKNIWIFICFRLKIASKKIDVRELQPWSIMTLSMQLTNKQMDPANVFLENER